MENRWTRRQVIKAAGLTAASGAFSFFLPKWLWAGQAVNLALVKQRYYQGIAGLAEYPYFEITEKGLLRLTVDGLEGGIDGHTHLALNSFAGGSPDLLHPSAQTLYYLPANIKSSLYDYANQSSSPREKKQMTRTIIRALLPFGSDVTDTHTIPNLLAEMDLLGIDKAVVLPIQMGWLFGDDMTKRYMDAVNQSGQKERFIVCGSVKPTLDTAVQDVKKYNKWGLKGIKMHPNFARFYPDDKKAWPVYEACGKLDLPVLIHSGRTGYVEKKTLGMKLYTEDYADIANFEKPFAAFPNTRFVLCHAGALQNEQAIKLAQKYPNVWLDIHGQGVGRIKAMIKEAGPERLMYGSDWAFYPEAAILVRMLIATQNDSTVRRMIFKDNAMRFWGLA